MTIRPSTREEIAACDSLIEGVRQKILELKGLRKRVHIIWDIDSVLTTPRSDDVFAKLGFNVERYFQYEERMSLEPLERGVWWGVARECGQSFDSQDIVTARSSYLLLRVQYFLLTTGLSTRWQLYVGHQSKADSYRIILQSFGKDKDAHVFMVDDGQKHVDAFCAVAAELGMSDRCHGIKSPQIRAYDEAEIEREIAIVMAPEMLGVPRRVCVTERGLGDSSGYGRYITLTPNGPDCLKDALQQASQKLHMAAIVEENRKTLEGLADELFPGKPKTASLLFYIYETTLEIAQRQWG